MTNLNLLLYFSDKTAVVNAKRFLLQPELYFSQVHIELNKDIKKMKSTVSVLTDFF